jgi:hypothetical protein
MNKGRATAYFTIWFSLLLLAACSSNPAPQDTLETEATISYSLFYKANGTAAFGIFDTLGNYTNVKSYSNFTKNWTHILKVGGGVLFYRASDGLADYARFNADGTYTELNASITFDPNWTHIIQVPSTNVIFFYRASDGLAATGRFNQATGAFIPLRDFPAGSFDPGWTHIMYSSKGNSVVFYKASTGLTVTAAVSSSGTVTDRNQFTLDANWSHLVNTPVGIFFYRVSDGFGGFGIINADGSFTDQKTFPVGFFTKGWTRIIQLPAGTLFYRTSDGLTSLGRFSVGGNFTDIKDSFLAPKWTLVTRAR